MSERDEHTAAGTLTAGQFQTMTDLSTKALRLYAQRAIIAPIDEPRRQRIARTLGEAMGREVPVVAGTLPTRAELSFFPPADVDRTPDGDGAPRSVFDVRRMPRRGA